MTEEEKKLAKSEQNSRYYQKHKGYCREYYKTHRERIRELQAAWREKNRERIRAMSRARYAETHVRKKRSKYMNEPPVTGKRVGMFLKADDNECYQWLKEHFEKQRRKENEHDHQMGLKTE